MLQLVARHTGDAINVMTFVLTKEHIIELQEAEAEAEGKTTNVTSLRIGLPTGRGAGAVELIG